MLMYSSHSCPSKQLINSKCAVQLVSVCSSDQWRKEKKNSQRIISMTVFLNQHATHLVRRTLFYHICVWPVISVVSLEPFESLILIPEYPSIPSLTVVSWCCDQFVLNALNIFNNVDEGDIGIKVVGGVAMVIILLSQGKRQFAPHIISNCLVLLQSCHATPNQDVISEEDVDYHQCFVGCRDRCCCSNRHLNHLFYRR